MFELLGYDIAQRTVHTGESIRMVFYLRALARTQTPVRLNLALCNNDGQMTQPEREWREAHLLIANHSPVFGHYPTSEWNPGEIIRDEVILRVDQDVPSTRVHLRFEARHDGPEGRLPISPPGELQNVLNLGDLEIIGAQGPQPRGVDAGTLRSP